MTISVTASSSLKKSVSVTPAELFSILPIPQRATEHYPEGIRS